MESNADSNSQKNKTQQEGPEASAPSNPTDVDQSTNESSSSTNQNPEGSSTTNAQAANSQSTAEETATPSSSEQATSSGDKVVRYTDLLEACGGAEGTVEKSVTEFLGEAVAGQDLKSLELHAVTPISWCPHLEGIRSLPGDRPLEVTDPCKECGHVGENWVCLTCFEVHCSRYVNEHMLLHGLETEHRMVLSYADLSVWCYACDQYVHHKDLFRAKDAVHLSKFGVESSGH